MNKFGGIVLLAIVAGAFAFPLEPVEPESELAINPSNEEETAGLTGDATVFADFCIKSRDYVTGDIKSQSNGVAANVFGVFFNNAGEIGQNALDVGKEATERLGNQIRNPDAEISESTDPSEAERIIAEGQQKIHDAQTQPRTFLQAVISTIGATGSAVARQVVKKLNNLTGYFGLDQVVGAVSNVCRQVNHYEEQNRIAFAEFAKTLAEKDPAIAATPFEKVACLTTKRISRLDGICKFSAVAKEPVNQIMKSMS